MRENSRVWSTRSSLTWIAASISPTSSSSTAPNGGHASSQPMRSWTAPVNAPLRWPNNSDSISVGDSADTFSAWNAPSRVAAKVSRSGSKGM